MGRRQAGVAALRLFGWTALCLGAFAVVGAAAAATPLFIYLVKAHAAEFSSKDAVMNRRATGVTLLDSAGRPFAHFGQARARGPVPLSEIPTLIRGAVLAAEDRTFYAHPGFNLRAMAASLLANYREGASTYGGSTITQQLAKNVFLDSRKDVARKYRELALSYELERRFSKDDILEMYLNTAYFGEGAFGIGEAARTYYGKDLAELGPGEAAMLAGLLVAPSAYSPVSGDPAKAVQRQRTVLSAMRGQGVITGEQFAAAASAAPVYVKPAAAAFDARYAHYALMVKDELTGLFGEEVALGSGMTVYTAFQPAAQAVIEEQVAVQLKALSGRNVANGAAVAMDPRSGTVIAVAGSAEYGSDKVNAATSLRQPGSSFKPIVYAAALERGLITPATLLNDAPTDFGGGYRPRDYDGRFRGPVTVRRSLAGSLNVPAVQVTKMVGVPAVLELAGRLGVRSLTRTAGFYGLPLGLGSGESSLVQMTGAYGSFARGGIAGGATTLISVSDRNGVERYRSPTLSGRALSDAAAYQITSMLSDPDARRETFGGELSLAGGRSAAVKTGTSQDYRDSWTIGYTPSLIVGIWFGNNDGSPMDAVAGALGAAPAWRRSMDLLLLGTPDEPFRVPTAIREVPVCRSRGLLLPPGSSGRYAVREAFLRGSEPSGACAAVEPDLPPTPPPSEPDPRPIG